MYRVVVEYHHPADPEAFLAHYRSTHAPIAQQMENLSAYTWGVNEMPDGSQPERFLTAVLDWPSKEAALADLGSQVGQEGTADMATFAQAGVSMSAYVAQVAV